MKEKAVEEKAAEAPRPVEAYGAALPPTLPSEPSKELSSNEFLLRLAAGELSEKHSKRKKVSGRGRLSQHGPPVHYAIAV